MNVVEVPSFLDFPIKCKFFTNAVINFDRIRAFTNDDRAGATGSLDGSRVHSDDHRLNQI